MNVLDVINAAPVEVRDKIVSYIREHLVVRRFLGEEEYVAPGDDGTAQACAYVNGHYYKIIEEIEWRD